MCLKEFLLFLLITIVNVKSQRDHDLGVPADIAEKAEDYKTGKCYRPADFFLVSHSGVGPNITFYMRTVSDKCEQFHIKYRQCCIFPPFYSRVVATACGAKTVLNFYDKKENITAATRVMTDDDCNHWRCVLSKYKQLVDDDTLDLDKYYRHLDKWADLNPKFKGVISQAEGRASEVFRMKLPLHVCAFVEINNFIRFFVTLDCPALIPTPECYEQKQVYHDCREYFLV